MAYRMVTCPETAHLEMIEIDPSPLGSLIVACSRFRPPDCVACPRSCTARLDARARLDRDDTLPEGDDDTRAALRRAG